MSFELTRIVVRKLRIPLPRPYKVSFNTYVSFDPIVVEVRDAENRVGYGEAHVPPNYSAKESPHDSWQACLHLADAIKDASTEKARQVVVAAIHKTPMAATAIISALDMLEGNAALQLAQEVRLPLVVPLSSQDPGAIRDEVERHVAAGYRTVKVKVGWQVDADLARVDHARRAVSGRALLRLDANRNYSPEDGRAFAARLDPEGIELFEQPCAAEDWDANASVAAVSRVPLMLDESIYTTEDIERAATIPNVRLVKLKLKRAGGVARLMEALRRAKELGLEVVVGDGVATEIACWMEACCSAHSSTGRAGEMNGFLKPAVRLFATPLGFEQGHVVVPAGFRPQLAERQLDDLSCEKWQPAVRKSSRAIANG